MSTFPFGCAVAPCKPSSNSPRRLFVLGAYPSALHVRWAPPTRSGLRSVKALAVANEPEPFWTGADEEEQIAAWKSAIGWSDGWGTIQPIASLNGSSGDWVERFVLEPLALERNDAWITDCLDTYRMSTGMASAIESVYEPFASQQGLPSAELLRHPDEGAIVREARDSHLDRLRGELATARPATVVTLGNAALRVMRHLVEASEAPAKLSPSPSYATPIHTTFDGNDLEWLPLAHPAAPKAYQHAHEAWCASRLDL